MNGMRKALFFGAFCLGLLLFLALPLTGAQRPLFSPGPGVHDGKAACAQCHRAFSSLSDCRGCHPIVSPYKSNPSFEFHNRLGKQSCTDCHHEHRGQEDKYAKSRFSHVDFPAARATQCQGCHTAPDKGVHLSIKQDLGCSDCHTYEGWKGSKFSHEGLSSTRSSQCISCHDAPKGDKHKSYGNGCALCHQNTSWKKAKFNHSAVGAAQAGQCIACHSAPGDNKHRLMVSSCSLCHQTGSWQRAGFNHRGLTAAGRVSCGVCHNAPREEHPQAGLDCGRCHSTRSWDDE